MSERNNLADRIAARITETFDLEAFVSHHQPRRILINRPGDGLRVKQRGFIDILGDRGDLYPVDHTVQLEFEEWMAVKQVTQAMCWAENLRTRRDEP